MFKNAYCNFIGLVIVFTLILNLCAFQNRTVEAEVTDKYADTELEIKYTSDFKLVWSDLFSNAKYNCCFYKPVVPTGYFSLGYYGQQNYENATGSVMVVKEMPNCKGALAKPVDYNLVWKNEGVFSFMKGYFWEPVPPAGYVAMGMVITNGKKPSVNEVVCVRQDLTLPAAAGGILWTDTNTSAKSKFSTWAIEPQSTTDQKSISSGTFVGVKSRTAPTTSSMLNCLKLRTTEDIMSSLTKSFDIDGYSVSKTIVKFNRIGLIAEHKTATNYDTKQKKKVYYVEGNHYEMGYLMGMLSEKDISVMVDDFSNGIILSYIKSYLKTDSSDLNDVLGTILIEVANRMSNDSYNKYMPQEIKDELRGVYEGCKEANPNTTVTMENLVTLNTGIDVLCSLAYTGGYLFDLIPELKPSDLQLPVWCNAFNVFGEAAGNGNYLGRDFMFNTADVFQDLATIVIYNPCSETSNKSLPFASQTAPGLIGSISAMNINGVAAGVDMSPGMNCNPEDVGVNSLLMVRRAVEFGSNAEQAVDIIKNTKRGVSWDYIIADGTNDRSCIVEAGASNITPDFFKYLPSELKQYLPDEQFLAQHKSTDFQNGMMVRWNDYKYPTDYLKFNEPIYNYYNSTHSDQITMHNDALKPQGYINKDLDERNCPSTYYFAPQREERNDVVLISNHYIIPEMRLYAMNPWTNFLVGGKTLNDIQWRYDELNNQILSAIDQHGYINYDKAKELIDFLAPYEKFPSYYENNRRSKDGAEIQIGGCVTLCDLKNKTMESHFGYYCDEWVKISLMNYFK